jgi:hypothetical protein
MCGHVSFLASDFSPQKKVLAQRKELFFEEKNQMLKNVQAYGRFSSTKPLADCALPGDRLGRAASSVALNLVQGSGKTTAEDRRRN